MTGPICIDGAFVSADGEPRVGSVSIEERRIAALGWSVIDRADLRRRAAEIVNGTGHWLMPGLIDAHIHAYGALLRGTENSLPLELWALHTTLYGRAFDGEALRAAIMLAAASIFAVLLGYSRVPYAAAVDGRFFKIFARLHPTKNFPTFSVLFIGAASAAACLLNLDALINALIVIQVLVQFLAQVFAVTLIRRNRPDILRPFSMPLYPITSIVAFLGWLYILAASGLVYIPAGFALLAFGIGAYLLRARTTQEWPFEVQA